MRMVLNFKGVGEFCLIFKQLLLLTRVQLTRRAVRLNAISLSFHKEMAKEREPKGLMPFGNPQRANVATFHSAHICAKASVFSFCERDLKKVALTEVARNQDNKSFFHLRRTLAN